MELKNYFKSIVISLKKINEEFLKSVITIFILALSKIIPHPPNFSPLLSVIIISSFIFQSRSLLLFSIFISMFLTDLYLGVYSGVIFTYIALFIIAVTSKIIFKDVNYKNIFFLSIYGSLVFYIVTTPIHLFNLNNFDHIISKLYQAYESGFIFFLNSLLSTITYSLFITFLFKKFHFKLFLKK